MPPLIHRLTDRAVLPAYLDTTGLWNSGRPCEAMVHVRRWKSLRHFQSASAVGLEQGGRLLAMVEFTRNKEVAVWVGRQRPRLRANTAGFIQISLNVS